MRVPEGSNATLQTTPPCPVRSNCKGESCAAPESLASSPFISGVDQPGSHGASSEKRQSKQRNSHGALVIRPVDSLLGKTCEYPRLSLFVFSCLPKRAHQHDCDKYGDARQRPCRYSLKAPGPGNSSPLFLKTFRLGFSACRQEPLLQRSDDRSIARTARSPSIGIVKIPAADQFIFRPGMLLPATRSLAEPRMLFEPTHIGI